MSKKVAHCGLRENERDMLSVGVSEGRVGGIVSLSCSERWCSRHMPMFFQRYQDGCFV